MLLSRKCCLSLVGTLAWSSTAAEMILTVIEAMSFSTLHGIGYVPSLAITTSSLNGVSLCSLAVYLALIVRHAEPTTRTFNPRIAVLSASVFFSLTALASSLALWIVLMSTTGEVSGKFTRAFIEQHIIPAHCATWALSCTTQIVLYTLPRWNSTKNNVQAVTTSGPRDSVMSELYPTKTHRAQESLQLTDSSTSSDSVSPENLRQTRSSQSLRSLRDSLRQVVRPVNSRTSLVSRKSLSQDARSMYSNSQSFDNGNPTDGFDAWDTSSVSPQARDAVMQTAPSLGTTLDPIPGSRPSSPSKVSDRHSYPDIAGATMEYDLPPPMMITNMSRPASSSISEAHIHPLFRSESPIPAPTATPGTSITASPWANQVIICPPRPLYAARSNSRTASPSPLARSPTPRNRSTSLPTPSRSPSPPSREMTPPIPDFILNSSPRSSMSGSRRVNLQFSPDRS